VTVATLSNDLKSGAISIPEWEAGMRDAILFELTAAMVLAKGGRDFVTQSDWGYVGSQAKKQYDYLGKFADEIAANPATWLTGNRLNARADLYGQVGYTALEDDLQREKLKSGYTEEINVLDPGAEHCSDTKGRMGCEEVTAKGWQPIGTLPLIGDRACWQNCRCLMKYRKPDPENPGKWIYGDDENG
jgi:hypothetical protein